MTVFSNHCPFSSAPHPIFSTTLKSVHVLWHRETKKKVLFLALVQLCLTFQLNSLSFGTEFVPSVYIRFPRSSFTNSLYPIKMFLSFILFALKILKRWFLSRSFFSFTSSHFVYVDSFHFHLLRAYIYQDVDLLTHLGVSSRSPVGPAVWRKNERWYSSLRKNNTQRLTNDERNE